MVSSTTRPPRASVLFPSPLANNPYNTTGVAQEIFGYAPTTYSSTTDANYWRAAMGVKGSYELGKEDWDWNVGTPIP
jgi:iron complex outermembrane receptor protein